MEEVGVAEGSSKRHLVALIQIRRLKINQIVYLVPFDIEQECPLMEN